MMRQHSISEHITMSSLCTPPNVVPDPRPCNAKYMHYYHMRYDLFNCICVQKPRNLFTTLYRLQLRMKVNTSGDQSSSSETAARQFQCSRATSRYTVRRQATRTGTKSD